jgi:diguanylate cyclase (GGDEF)-like protein
MHSILYVEINLLAILVLLIIMDRGARSVLTMDRKLLKYTEISLIVVMALDIFTWMLDGASFPGAGAAVLISQYAYWLASQLPCYLAAMYYCSVTYEHAVRKCSFILAVPVLWSTAAVLTNPLTGWIFTIDAGNVYHRGPYFLLAGSVGFIHFGAAMFLAARKRAHTDGYERKRCTMLMEFLMVAVCGSLLQVFIYGLVTIWTSVTLAMLMCYVFIQNGNLAMDPLTRLNNRRRFDAFAKSVCEESSASSLIGLIVMDIDHFKNINDSFGHAEGDLALIRTADALRKAMEKESGLLARIGGDEFAVLTKGVSSGQIQELVRKLQKSIEAANQKDVPYQIYLSIGYSFHQGKMKSTTELFREADRKMYESKREKTCLL